MTTTLKGSNRLQEMLKLSGERNLFQSSKREERNKKLGKIAGLLSTHFYGVLMENEFQ